jgi:hypothetical protein
MNSLYGNFRTRTFCEIFPDLETFKEEYEATPLVSIENVDQLYFLLYARYGNSNIASSDENQFKYKLWSTIFMYGPTWEKRLDVQQKLRALNDDELIAGGNAVHNTALNPGTQPTSSELPYINQQNTTKYKKSKLEGYATLLTLLETDVTEDFINKFKKLFLTVVNPELPLWYITEGDK